MIPFWEIYSASVNTTEPLPNASESSNPKSEFQSDKKRHNFTWIRRLSPIIGISILGVASSCFGYYTARNQFIVAQNPPGNIVWPIPGISEVIVYEKTSNFDENCIKNFNSNLCYKIKDNVALVVNPNPVGNKQRGNKSYDIFEVIECADGSENPQNCDAKVKNKRVEGTFLVCEQRCGVNISNDTWKFQFIGQLNAAKIVVYNLTRRGSPPISFLRESSSEPRNTAW